MNTIESTKDVLGQTIDRFWETFPAVWTQIRSNIRKIVTESFDISVEQFHILRHIRKGICSISDLATVKQISRPAISQSVDALVVKALITRRQSQEDRRYVELELTPEGINMLNAIFEKNHSWLREKMAHVTAEDLDRILQAMTVLKKTFIE
jgi:DNA-binding MarR family transcriptional regulator